MSISEARRELELNAHYTKGFAEGMGIKLEWAGPSLIMSRADFERLKRRVEEVRRSQMESAAS